MWGSPGGFCEVGEHPIETVEREVLEETGLQVEVTGYLGVWVDDYADDPEAEADVINVAYYLARPTGTAANPTLPRSASIGWFAWDDLPAELAPPGTLDAVLAAARSGAAVDAARRPALARLAGALVDGVARDVELAALDPLAARGIERVRVVQELVRGAHVPAHLELEEPERVPGLRVLGLELDRLHVALLRVVVAALALVDPRQRPDRLDRRAD